MGHSVDFGQSQMCLQAQAQPVIKDSLRIIGDLVENVLNEITQTKTLCFNCVKVIWPSLDFGSHLGKGSLFIIL